MGHTVTKPTADRGLTPDLLAAAVAAWRLHERHANQAGQHLAISTKTARSVLARVHRQLADEYAAEAGAALLEADDLARLARLAREAGEPK